MKIYLKTCILIAVAIASILQGKAQVWQAIEPDNLPEKRHENAMAAVNGKIYLLGGRSIKPVNEYDPRKDTWTELSKSPIEMSHFQAVTYKHEVYVLGALTGSYPHETPIPDIYIFNPAKNEWRKGDPIPKDRLRGAAGAFVLNNKIYLICGIQDGHWDGQVAWFDEYDPATSKWKTLPDAPRPRDHVQVAVADNRLLVAGGRLSSAKTNQVLNTTIKEVDLFDFNAGKWTSLEEEKNIPTMRAGHTAVTHGSKVLLIGGESGAQQSAHAEVEAFNMQTQKWERYPSLHQGRHGTQAVVINKKIYIAAGSANRGGGPELNNMEVLVK